MLSLDCTRRFVPSFRCGRVGGLAALVALALALGTSGAAEAKAPPRLAWTDLLPGLTTAYDPSSENACTAGRTSCVDAVIREMTRRFRPLAASCDHNSIFALSYLRTTEEYRRTIEDPTFFEDTRFVNHEDAVFATYYFDAVDDWKAGRKARVPLAWRIAFRAADDRAISASGNLYLGVSAHVNRDLPYVLAGIGLVKPDGTSRKPDHDKVNVFLERVTEPLIAEIARRFDPTVDDNDLPTSIDNLGLFQVIPAWREAAWRNAELLVNAVTPLDRAVVAQKIEAEAATVARTFRRSTAYVPGSQDGAARDAYCAARR